MSNFVGRITDRVFGEDVDSLADRLKRHKAKFFGALLAIVITVAYFGQNPLVTLLVYTLDQWILYVVVAWLVAITLYLYGKEKSTVDREFADDFRRGLIKWESYGDWKLEHEESGDILSVTNSDAGGIIKSCRLWDDYAFEFETKIVASNSSRVIRASDILNYVMLQCGQNELKPHFRVSGQWFVFDPIPIANPLPLHEWIKVHIAVSGTRVVARVSFNGKEYTLIDQRLLEPKILTARINVPDAPQQVINFAFNFPMGSVGFRESGAECSHFRNIKVKRLLTSPRG